jgi:sodium-dependent dicarboxylate transporter 2/3/5
MKDGFPRRRRIGLILGPLILMILIMIPTPSGVNPAAMRLVAVIGLMSVWWVSEAVPLSVTALLPMALFPLFNIMPSQRVAPNYMTHFAFLMVGGFLIAFGMEKWNLHKRIALHVVRVVGSSPGQLLMGFMVASAVLSLWISNTATTMMLLPVGMAVVNECAEGRDGAGSDVVKILGPVLMMSIAFGASIGGMGTMVGSPTNLVFVGFAEEMYADLPPLGYFDWLLFGIPIVVLFLPVTWFVLYRFGGDTPLRLLELNASVGKNVIRRKLSELGPVNRGERMILTIFVTLIALWTFRKPIEIGWVRLPGWSELGFLPDDMNYIQDATVAVAMALLLFCVPVRWKEGEFLLDFSSGLKSVPWDMLMVFGGGFAIAAGMSATGLDQLLGQQLLFLKGAPLVLIIFGITAFAAFLTELVGNTPVAALLMPILAAMSVAIGVHPYLLMIPATISASCAFMLPVGTMPNIIIFGSGWLRIDQTVRVGLYVKLVGIVIISLVSWLIVPRVYGLAG